MLKEELSDIDLVILIRAGSKYAEKILYDRYYKYSLTFGKRFAFEYQSTHITSEEFTSVAFSVVPEVIKKCKIRNFNFKKYWSSVAKNASLDYINANKNYLILQSQTSLSLDESFTDDERTLASNLIGEEDEKSELSEILFKYIYSPSNNLTNEETLIAYLLFVREFSYSEIIEYTGWKKDRVSYVEKKTKEKIQEFLKHNYL